MPKMIFTVGAERQLEPLMCGDPSRRKMAEVLFVPRNRTAPDRAQSLERRLDLSQVAKESLTFSHTADLRPCSKTAASGVLADGTPGDQPSAAAVVMRTMCGRAAAIRVIRSGPAIAATSNSLEPSPVRRPGARCRRNRELPVHPGHRACPARKPIRVWALSRT
jgi:hypothetical protein